MTKHPLTLDDIGPGSVGWELSGRSILLMGGAYALIMQVAHPQVAAGVAQHSRFKEDPWGRLLSTIDIQLGIIFSQGKERDDRILELKRMHHKIRGVDEKGKKYHAMRPDLFYWVHASLVETTLLYYQLYYHPLSAEKKERYYQESIALAEAYGIRRDKQPANYLEFQDYYQDMINNTLEATDTLKDVWQTIRQFDSPAFLPHLFSPAWKLGTLPIRKQLQIVTAKTLPPHIRESLGIHYNLIDDALFFAQRQTIKTALPIVPRRFSLLPHAYRTLAHQTV